MRQLSHQVGITVTIGRCHSTKVVHHSKCPIPRGMESGSGGPQGQPTQPTPNAVGNLWVQPFSVLDNINIDVHLKGFVFKQPNSMKKQKANNMFNASEKCKAKVLASLKRFGIFIGSTKQLHLPTFPSVIFTLAGLYSSDMNKEFEHGDPLDCLTDCLVDSLVDSLLLLLLDFLYSLLVLLDWLRLI